LLGGEARHHRQIDVRAAAEVKHPAKPTVRLIARLAVLPPLPAVFSPRQVGLAVVQFRRNAPQSFGQRPSIDGGIRPRAGDQVDVPFERAVNGESVAEFSCSIPKRAD
jgi:hypothetical protein